jgi:hypothetical protein
LLIDDAALLNQITCGRYSDLGEEEVVPDSLPSGTAENSAHYKMIIRID